MLPVGTTVTYGDTRMGAAVTDDRSELAGDNFRSVWIKMLHPAPSCVIRKHFRGAIGPT